VDKMILISLENPYLRTLSEFFGIQIKILKFLILFVLQNLKKLIEIANDTHEGKIEYDSSSIRIVVLILVGRTAV
jgi:very-short-patch-repair endonuclease